MVFQVYVDLEIWKWFFLYSKVIYVGFLGDIYIIYDFKSILLRERVRLVVY